MSREHRAEEALRCPQCGRRLAITPPQGANERAPRTTQCRAGHAVLFRYDGVIPRLVEFIGEER